MGSQRVRHDWMTFTCISPVTRKQLQSQRYSLWEKEGRLREFLVSSFCFLCKKVEEQLDWICCLNIGHPWWLSGKESACNAGDRGLIPGLGRFPGEGNGNPLQYSCLGNPMGRGAWRAIVYGVTRVRHDWATNTFIFIQISRPGL